MRLDALFKSGKFVVTGEVAPPKGAGVDDMLREARGLSGLCDAVNVTDNQSAVMRLSSLAAACKLKEAGFEPVYQLTCRDRNRLAMQSDLLGAASLGIKNVLLLTGDFVNKGDHPDAKPVYDLDSVQLIHMARELTQGRDMAGHRLSERPDFCIGAVTSPLTRPMEGQIIKLAKKAAAGASFVQTQAVFDAGEFSQFINGMEKYGIRMPVLAGVVLVKSAKMARFMNERVPGVKVPDEIISELENTPAEKMEETAVRIAARLISELKSMVSGIHLMPLGWTHLVPFVLKQAGLC